MQQDPEQTSEELHQYPSDRSAKRVPGVDCTVFRLRMGARSAGYSLRDLGR
jgi:hypothetical protein